MELKTTLVVAGFGGCLTLFGILIQVFLQATLKRSEERRAFAREWHNASIDILIKLHEYQRYVRRAATCGLDDRMPIDELHTYRMTEIDQGLARIEVGHPSRRVRSAAHKVDFALTLVGSMAWMIVRIRRALGDLPPDDEWERRRFEAMQVLDNAVLGLSRRVHGQVSIGRRSVKSSRYWASRSDEVGDNLIEFYRQTEEYINSPVVHPGAQRDGGIVDGRQDLLSVRRTRLVKGRMALTQGHRVRPQRLDIRVLATRVSGPPLLAKLVEDA